MAKVMQNITQLKNAINKTYGSVTLETEADIWRMTANEICTQLNEISDNSAQNNHTTNGL